MEGSSPDGRCKFLMRGSKLLSEAGVFPREMNQDVSLAAIMDWLLTLCNYFRFCRWAAYKARSLLIAYCEQKALEKSCIQGYAAAAFLIASKICNDIVFVPLEHIARLTGGACTIRDIKEAEIDMLMTLDWD